MVASKPDQASRQITSLPQSLSLVVDNEIRGKAYPILEYKKVLKTLLRKNFILDDGRAMRRKDSDVNRVLKRMFSMGGRMRAKNPFSSLLRNAQK